MRTRARAVLVLLTLVATLLVGVAVEAGPAFAVTGTPTMTSPLTSSSWNNSQVTVTYSLPDSPAPGTVQLTFVGTGTCVFTMTNAQNVSFVFNADNPVSGANVVSATPSGCSAPLPSRTYTVAIRYQNQALDPAASATSTNVLISGITPPPTFTSPAGSSTWPNRHMTIGYALPGPPASGTATLRFVGATTCTYTMADAQNVSFSLDGDNPLAGSSGNIVSASPSGCATNLPNGTYSVTVAYQDAALDPTATTTATNVVLAGPATTTTTTTTTTTAPGAPTTTVAGAGGTTAAPTTTSAAVAANGANRGTTLATTGSMLPIPLVVGALLMLLAGCGLFVASRRTPHSHH